MQQHIPHAYRRACDLFLKRTGISAFDYLADKLNMASVTMYQYQEVLEDGSARRNLKWEMAVLVTETFNARYDELEAPRDFTILRAFNANAGLLTIEKPRGASASGDRAVAKSLNELNDLVQAYADGGVDRKFTAAEMAVIRKEAFEAHEAIEGLVAEAEAMAETPNVVSMARQGGKRASKRPRAGAR